MEQDLKSLHYNTKQQQQQQQPQSVDRQSVLPAQEEQEAAEEQEEEEGPRTAPLRPRLFQHVARLQPNVKGCGYPPDVECNGQFAPTYGVVGENFSCFYSTVDPTLVITHLDIERVRTDLVYCLTIPVFLFAVSVVYLFYAYFKIYAPDAAAAAAAAAGGVGGGGGSASARPAVIAQGNWKFVEQLLQVYLIFTELYRFLLSVTSFYQIPFAFRGLFT